MRDYGNKYPRLSGQRYVFLLNNKNDYNYKDGPRDSVYRIKYLSEARIHCPVVFANSRVKLGR